MIQKYHTLSILANNLIVNNLHLFLIESKRLHLEKSPDF